VLSALDGVVAMKVAGLYDYFPQQMSELLRQHTKPEDKLIVYTCDPIWGSEVLWRSARQGFSVAAVNSTPDSPSPKGLYELLNTPEDLRRLKELGYNRIVL